MPKMEYDSTLLCEVVHVFLECITVNGPYTSKLDMSALNLISRLLVRAPLFEMCVAVRGFVHELVATMQRCVHVYVNPSLPKDRTNGPAP